MASTGTAAHAPTLGQRLLAEYDYEIASTRTVLTLVPLDKRDWKPHPTSMSLGQLATFTAGLPRWITTTIELDCVAGMPPSAANPDSTAALVALLDNTAAIARERPWGASDARLEEPWTLQHDDKTVLRQPRATVIRLFGLNHLIHHRGQLSVYLRMVGVKVPAIYGPSADEDPW